MSKCLLKIAKLNAQKCNTVCKAGAGLNQILIKHKLLYVRKYCHTTSSLKNGVSQARKNNLKSGPSLQDFINLSSENDNVDTQNLQQTSATDPEIPYIDRSTYSGRQRKVYFDTYGCQMNFSDTEVVWSILRQNEFLKADNLDEADVVLVMTCAIREGAEEKIWKRIDNYKGIKRRRQKHYAGSYPSLKIGILGCMAERLKSRILEKEKVVDLVCGPDAYRDLPRMLAITETNQTAVNVLLSLDETYADIVPVRLNEDSSSAYVSIMRGCDNMCTYCIVPFTRGRERSRPITSILDEVRALSDQGVREITLLGQNVNSYRDRSEDEDAAGSGGSTRLSDGFSTIYRPKMGGLRFADLLDKVSMIDPEMRIRFTSPHPKDFPDEVLQLIKERANICNHIHLPAQSGNNDVLASMRRGYTREAYLTLVDNIRSLLPDMSLTGDFIAGFCGETEEAHLQSVDLIERVLYDFAYCFPYSMREKTRAYHRLQDDVPEDVKSRRHMELIAAFRRGAEKLHASQIGAHQLVLIEGDSKRSSEQLAGRNDGNTKVIIDKMDVPSNCHSGSELVPIKPGNYVAVKIVSSSSQVLKGVPLYHTTLQDFNTQPRMQEKHSYNI